MFLIYSEIFKSLALKTVTKIDINNKNLIKSNILLFLLGLSIIDPMLNSESKISNNLYVKLYYTYFLLSQFDISSFMFYHR